MAASTRGTAREDLPPAIDLEDGLDEQEVSTLTLWRNPTLRAELTRIDSAHATLDEARRPANPQFSILGPIGPVTALATLLLPLESLWQMPHRTAVAARDADFTGESVLMRALDLVRDARLLHIELGLAEARATIRQDLEELAEDTARITRVRNSVGDISPLDAYVLDADARLATDASVTAGAELTLARSRLAAELALDEATMSTLTVRFSEEEASIPELRELLLIARRARPDALAAQFALSSALEKTGWERSRVLSVQALTEVHWSQPEGPALRLGGRIELPLFGMNPGGIGRAEAEVERSLAEQERIARTCVQEVTVAHVRLLQATRSRRLFERDILPALEEALTIATRSFESGDDSYLVVLDVLRRTGEARLRHADLIAERRRALCELERALGARLRNSENPADRKFD